MYVKITHKSLTHFDSVVRSLHHSVCLLVKIYSLYKYLLSLFTGKPRCINYASRKSLKFMQSKIVYFITFCSTTKFQSFISSIREIKILHIKKMFFLLAKICNLKPVSPFKQRTTFVSDTLSILNKNTPFSSY